MSPDAKIVGQRGGFEKDDNKTADYDEGPDMECPALSHVRSSPAPAGGGARRVARNKRFAAGKTFVIAFSFATGIVVNWMI